MLGYVRAYKPDLKMRDYEFYRGIYCSLCRALGRNYGPLAQLFLSYDFALAALIRFAVCDDKCVFERKHCPYNPAKKCLCCQNRGELDFCAHAVIITIYYKIKDNIRDKGFASRALAALLYLPVYLMYRKAKRKAPEVDAIICEAMEQQLREEKAGAALDAAAHPSAAALGRIFAIGQSGDAHTSLYTLGYMIGRFVYILDAADDLESDVKRGNYNPFAAKAGELSQPGGRKAFAEFIGGLLNLTQHEAVNAFKAIKTNRFEEVIENIVYDGLSGSAANTLKKYSGDKRHKTIEI